MINNRIITFLDNPVLMIHTEMLW